MKNTQIYEVPGHVPSYLPEGKKWRLTWADEFDGTELDMTKWDYRLSMMGKRHPAWTDRGVHLDGESNAVFTLLKEDGRPVSSQLQTGFHVARPTQDTRPVCQFSNTRLSLSLACLPKHFF